MLRKVGLEPGKSSELFLVFRIQIPHAKGALLTALHMGLELFGRNAPGFGQRTNNAALLFGSSEKSS